MIRDAIAAIVSGNDLTEEEASQCMQELMSDEATPSQAAALLVALRMKGETVDEITGMVRVMREKALHVDAGPNVLDVVGTGGGFDPFNISTAASLVCAGAGARVVKHGNRGFTSSSGAADVLEALGAKLELTPEQMRVVVEKAGFAFLFAQSLHPAMRFVGPTRREIGVRTVFNSLGPLTNPAGARYQLIGVSTMEMADKVSQVLRRLGTGRALVVHSDDGMDEVSLGAPTTVHEVTGNDVRTYTLTADDLGLPAIPPDEVLTGTKDENAARMRDLLDGAESADRQYVLANAGLALYAVERVHDIKTGVEQARRSIDSGSAKRVLEAYVAATNSFGG